MHTHTIRTHTNMYVHTYLLVIGFFPSRIRSSWCWSMTRVSGGCRPCSCMRRRVGTVTTCCATVRLASTPDRTLWKKHEHLHSQEERAPSKWLNLLATQVFGCSAWLFLINTLLLFYILQCRFIFYVNVLVLHKCTQALTHTRTPHTLTYTLTRTHTPRSHTHTHTHTTLTPTHTRSHTHTHHTHTHTHTLTHTHTHTHHTHTHTHTLTHTHITLTHTHTHTHPHTLTHTHTHTHPHTHTHTTLCRAQWRRGRASDSRLRETGFESCVVVLKCWASFCILHCSSSLSCIN